jgi:hypothetical protein
MRRATAEPVTRARITTTFGTVAATFHTGDGRRLLLDSLPLLMEAKHTARKLDLWKRSISVESIALRLVDAAREVSRFLTATNVIGKRLQVDRGEASMASLSDYAIAHDGLVITDWREEAGEVTIETEDPFSFNLDEEREAYWTPGHPLAVIRQMLLAVIPASMLGDASLNELTYATLGHLVVSRHPYNWSGVGNTELQFGKQTGNGFDMLNELLFLIRGTLRAGAHRTSGLLTYIQYDPDRAVDHELFDGDFTDVVVIDNAEKKINHVLIEGHGRANVAGGVVSPDQAKTPYYERTDPASPAAHAWPVSASPEPKLYKAESDDTYIRWLNSFEELRAAGNASLNAGGTNIMIVFPQYFGFSGTSITDSAGARLSPPVSTIQPNHQISAARPAYFLITDHNKLGGIYEFIRCEGFAYDTSAGSTSFNTPTGTESYWNRGNYTIAARGLFGSSAIDWQSYLFTAGVDKIYVYDITTALYFGSTIIQRHADGVPIIDLKLAPQFYGIEEGDTIAFRDDELKIPNHNGVTNAVVWEVLSAEDHTMEDMPCIHVRAALLRDAAVGPADGDPDDFGDKIPGGTVGEVYYDASGAIYTDASGDAYTNY